MGDVAAVKGLLIVHEPGQLGLLHLLSAEHQHPGDEQKAPRKWRRVPKPGSGARPTPRVLERTPRTILHWAAKARFKTRTSLQFNPDSKIWFIFDTKTRVTPDNKTQFRTKSGVQEKDYGGYQEQFDPDSENQLTPDTETKLSTDTLVYTRNVTNVQTAL